MFLNSVFKKIFFNYIINLFMNKKITYYEMNKEAVKKYQKEYFAKNREKMRAYQREYQKKLRLNPEYQQKKAAYMKIYAKDYWRKYAKANPEKIKEYTKRWHEKNREHIRAYQKQYYNTPKGKKYQRIANWKQIGIVDTDLHSLYDIYIKETNCWICGCEYKNKKHRHLDHDHETGEVRFICCRDCNIQILSNVENE
jgi:hypothetical protein